MGLKKLVKQVMTNKNNTRYKNALEARRTSYHDWITDFEAVGLKGRAPGAMCRGDALAESEELYVLFQNPKGRLQEHAKEWIQMWFEAFPEALIIYGDEDVWAGETERRSPRFKPDWSPDLFDTEFYLGNLVAVRKSWFENVAKDTWENDVRRPGEPEREELAAYQSFVRHCVRLAGGYEKGQGRKTILHIPRILFHSESEENRDAWMRYVGSVAPGAGTDCAGKTDGAADADREAKKGVPADRRLSIVIPSKDNPDLLEKCIESILRTTTDLQYEIVVVDNGSAPENRVQIEAKLKRVRQSGAKGLTLLLYHYEPMDFNFSKMCNLGARKASGELLFFLNDDVELAMEGTLRVMAQLASRPYTGAVGLKLLYPDAKTLKQIQHVGITNLPMGPVHKLQFCRDDREVVPGWNRGRHNALAVTAACLMVDKEKFQEAGGFAEELAVAFNDVDLCFGLYELGYENVCECDLFAWHDESYSRGDDESPEKLERLLAERAKLYTRHPDLDGTKKAEGADPYYSVFWNRDGLDTRIRPIYETLGNRVQQIAAGDLERTTKQDMSTLREDKCLLVRVESALEDGEGKGLRITGWGVVLGDNNACYDKYLVFQGEESFVTLLQGQYRPDLTENMPDQENVGLSGYQILLEKGALPAGTYRLGMAAASRVGRVKLVNWSNRTIDLEN